MIAAANGHVANSLVAMDVAPFDVTIYRRCFAPVITASVPVSMVTANQSHQIASRPSSFLFT